MCASHRRGRHALVPIVFGLVIAGAFVRRALPGGSARDATAPSPKAAPGSPTLVELGTQNCTSCEAMKPVLAALRRTHGCALHVRFIDAWADPEAAAPFAVTTIPTQILLDPSGAELTRHTGFWSAASITAAFAAHDHKLEVCP